MAEKRQKYSAGKLDATGEFFSVGSPLHAVRPGYVRRPADDLLYDTIVSGNYAHVIAPDRTGKSSLIAATSARLQNNGFKVAVLDLAQIGERDGGTDAGRWYYSIAYRLLRQLRIKVDLQAWWQDKAILSNRQRLVEFYIEVILQNIPERVVVFVDEIQRVGEVPFNEHLLPSIRAAHNSRRTDPDLNRLCFVLIGECDPFSLVSDPTLSPFSVSQEVRLGDFTREDLNVFAMELNLSRADAEAALDRIWFWTSGQPYLSQKLGRSVSRERIEGDIAGHVDRIAMQQLAGRAALHSEPHMSHIDRIIVADRKNHEGLLNLYGRVRKGIEVEYEPEQKLHRRLMSIGLVRPDDDGYLRVRNRIYETVFTARWANENLPLHWRGPAIAAAILLALTAIPFWYTQLLPNPYLRVMSAPTADLEAVYESYVNLRSFPGHADAADRMFRNTLENRARQATDRNTIHAIDRFARQLADAPGFADNLLAGFWDRQVQTALRAEDRDSALLAALESLEVSTPIRRRRAASLIGDDYPRLVGTIPGQAADVLLFNSENMLLSAASGAQVRQWSLSNQELQPREPWTISALEVTPLLRRVVVDREGAANRIGVSVNVSHARLDDLRLKLIAPSGRIVEINLGLPSSSANQDIRIPREQLESLVGEPLNGTWSLSIRDEALGVSGYLVGWNLNLNSQVAVESFERGLDIPDPVERESDQLWFSSDGRQAVARAQQSDSARLWDLNFARPARTMAVPASERVIGVSANAEFVVTATQETVHLWSTVGGGRDTILEIGAASAELTANGAYLLVTKRAEPDTELELWSIAERRITASMSVAGSPALITIDASGRYLALADYDRAVRVWDFADGLLLSQIDLDAQPSAIELSASGDTLGVVHGDQGVSLWRVDLPGAPLLRERGDGDWRLMFSPSGSRVVAGNSRQGYQVYRSSDGAVTGPMVASGFTPGQAKLLAFSHDENIVVTATASEMARFWHVPATVSALDQGAVGGPPAAHELWQGPGSSVTAISPGGQRLAVGDHSGHVHIVPVGTGGGPLAESEEDINFIGHHSAVVGLTFSHDGALVASAGFDGTIRIWDAHSGLPRPFYSGAPAGVSGQMVFSPSSQSLAVLSGQRVWIMETETGTVIADIELGESHADAAFVANDNLVLASESGSLRSMTRDRSGNWQLRDLWHGPEPLRRVEVSPTGQQLVVVDALHHARLLNVPDGRVGREVLQLPNAVADLAFSPSESRVLFNTVRWIHRAIVTPGGLIWEDAIRAPRAVPGSRMVFDGGSGSDDDPSTSYVSDPSADRVLMLTRDSGFAELAELRFSHTAGASVVGNRDQLLSEWRTRLRGEPLSDFDREGF